MLRRLSAGLLATAALVAPLAATAQEGSAEDLGVMSISLADVVKPTIGLQGSLQGAGTPNQAGIGVFWPFSVGENSVWFLDALVNANFADRKGLSSIVHTYVDGTTVSTSSRIGYRRLNSSKSSIYGVNAGFDSRQVKSGSVVDFANRYSLSMNEKTPIFTQLAVEAELVTNAWHLKPYALMPIGDKEQKLNTLAYAGALSTYGINAGYNLNEKTNIEIGYYYQQGDIDVSNSGVKAKATYEVSPGMDIYGVTSYDDAFDSRFSIGFSYSFSKPHNGSADSSLILKALQSSPENRNIRIHDCDFWDSCWWDQAASTVEKAVTPHLTPRNIIRALNKIYSRLPDPLQKIADDIEANPSDALDILAENPELDAEVLAEVIAE